MATLDFTGGSITVSPMLQESKRYEVSCTLDFSDADNNAAVSDICNIFDFGPGTYIEKVIIEVDTAEGATCTIDFGMTHSNSTSAVSSVTALASSLDCNSAGYTISGYSGEITTATHTLVQARPDHATDAAIVKVTAFCADLS